MRSQKFLLIILILATVPAGCRRETPEPQTAAEAEAETVAEQQAPPPDVRAYLDEIEPAIPLWPGARATGDGMRTEGIETIIDLWTNDPLPMVWHYYVNYLAQYRAWDPVDPYPDRSDRGRHLALDLNEVMQDPFVPDTALSRTDVHVMLEIREDPSQGRVNIRYTVRQRN